MNTLMTLALGAVAFSGTPTTATDPLLVGLTGKLANNDQVSDASITSLYAITGDPAKPQSMGGFEFRWTNPKTNLKYVLEIIRMDSYTLSDGRYYFKGRGRIHGKGFEAEVQAEWSLQDNKKQGDPADAPGDLFSLHLFRPKSDFDFTTSWNSNSFTSVEIYKPTN